MIRNLLGASEPLGSAGFPILHHPLLYRSEQALAANEYSGPRRSGWRRLVREIRRYPRFYFMSGVLTGLISFFVVSWWVGQGPAEIRSASAQSLVASATEVDVDALIQAQLVINQALAQMYTRQQMGTGRLPPR